MPAVFHDRFLAHTERHEQTQIAGGRERPRRRNRGPRGLVLGAALSIEPVANADPVKSAAYFSAERDRWAPIVKTSGAKME